jgi:hypothetical protein
MCPLPESAIVVYVMVEAKQRREGGRSRARATKNQKQPTEGCTNEEVVLYEAYSFGVGGSCTDGGDGS